MDHPENSPLWPADSPAATAHIALLQGVITRLANNSASSKTWCLTLVAALLSLAGAAHAPQIVIATIVPIVIFGFVDILVLRVEAAEPLRRDERQVPCEFRSIVITNSV